MQLIIVSIIISITVAVRQTPRFKIKCEKEDDWCEKGKTSKHIYNYSNIIRNSMIKLNYWYRIKKCLMET